MTDIETLITYRLQQAQESLHEAHILLEQKCSPRAVINRVYYAMFYAVLALLLSSDSRINSAKHSRVIGTFDKEFIHTGKIEARFSRSFHRAFEVRLKADYIELTEPTHDEAVEQIKSAEEFVSHIQAAITGKPS